MNMNTSYIVSWLEGGADSRTVRTRWTIEEAYQMAFSSLDSGMEDVTLTHPTGEVVDHAQLRALRPS